MRAEAAVSTVVASVPGVHSYTSPRSRQPPGATSPRSAGGIAPAREPVGRWARRLLNCPVAAAPQSVAGAFAGVAAQLDSLCNVR